MQKQKLVVIGNGMAGARAVEEILARGGADSFEITMFGDEPYGNYNRILLSNVLNRTQEESGIFLNPLAWYRENDITLHAGVRAETILRKSRVVLADDGTGEAYDKLIIATGSRSYIPPVEGLLAADGSYKAGLFVFRSLDDCREIAVYAQGRGRAIVIGGGLLGLEAARGLQNFGLQVEVVHRGGHLMGQQLDAQAGAILKTTMAKMDVRVHLRKNTTAILGGEKVEGLAFADGTSFDCDLVLIATVISPNVEIGARSGLTVERAIVVDNQMRAVDETQICNCNGISKGALMACVKGGRRSLKSVMEATRACMGCGSCKSMVSEVLEWACGGELDEDPSAHYYVPGVPLSKPELIRACREQNLKSVSAVFAALARFINERVHATSRRAPLFRWCPRCLGE